MGEAVVSGCDPAKVLDPSEHALDGVATAVEGGREADFPAPVGLWRNVRCGALAFDLAADGVAIVALVAVQDFGGLQLIEQGIGGDTIGDLAAGQEERDRAAEMIGERVDLRGSPTPGTADRLGEFPPLPPEAQR